MKFLQKVLYIIKNLKLCYTKFKYRKFLCTSNKSRDLKNFVGKDYTVRLSSTFDERKKRTEQKIENLVKKAENNPYRLIKYIEKHGTSVYKIKNADKILATINESEGFITPKKGLKALYLNTIINKKFSLIFKECFILRDIELEPYSTIQQFYTWFAFKSGFAGYEYETQEKFHKIINSKNEKENIDNLTISDIIAVKEAIKRDIDAIDFVIRIAKNKDGAKAVFEKMLARKESVKL